MPTLKLTQAAVERLKPPATGRVEYWDSQCPGFGLGVSAPAKGREGRKTWQVLYRVGGKLVRETIGTIGTFPSVADARKLARESLQKAEHGINPIEERRHEKAEEERRNQAAEARARDTLAAAIDRYLEEARTGRNRKKPLRPDYVKELGRSLEVDVKPALGDRPIRELSRREIRELLAEIVNRGAPSHANHVLAYLRAMLSWAVRQDIIEKNPADGIWPPAATVERDRHLDNEEIRLFWLSCDTIGWPFGPLFQLLLLTAVRRDELAHANWGEFDLERRLWTLPRQRTKNDKGHLTHLSPPAIEIIEALPRPTKGGLVFTTNDRTPVSGFGHARERLAAAMLELTDGGRAITPFTLHDLRRTAATTMAEELKVAPHVVDKILNHTASTIRGVARVYNLAEYLEERRVALEAWGRYIAGLVRHAPENVVELATAR